MLDFRHETFLTLYKIGSYTKTAEILHLTQPAVTQHIQFLENYYNCKLFSYKGKVLQATQEARKLYNFATSMRADSEKLRSSLKNFGKETESLNFGATLTIGEYLMPKIVEKLLIENENLKISMEVDNTKTLLETLSKGKLDFVLLEGFFNGEDYDSRLLMHADFVPICGASSPFANGAFTLKELLPARLITREKGSGTREVLEQVMAENNLSLDGFNSLCEIGNINAIKHLVERNFGVAFLYKAACKEEINQGKLVEIKLSGITIQRAFNFVYLKDSLRKDEITKTFEMLRERL
ncbi:MAG: LysR family transcriptional regulator [Oscillospiraceae bacterium]